MNGRSPPGGRREFLISGGAVATGALAGCLGSGRAENTLSGNVRIAGGNEFPLLGSAVERFERSHPDVHVSREDWEGSDETPDIRFEGQPLSNEGTETEGDTRVSEVCPTGRRCSAVRTMAGVGVSMTIGVRNFSPTNRVSRRGARRIPTESKTRSSNSATRSQRREQPC